MLDKEGDNMTPHTKIYVNGMTLRQIAEENNLPLPTVIGRYQRGDRTYDRLSRDYSLHNNEYRLEVATERWKRFLKAAMDRNLTMKEIEEKTGIARSCIWSFINNNSDISSMRLAKLCGAVGVSMDYVMGLRGK